MAMQAVGHRASKDFDSYIANVENTFHKTHPLSQFICQAEGERYAG